MTDDKNVLWLDCYGNFIAPDGTIGRDILGDDVHPTAKGYEIWRDAVLPVFRQLCGQRR